MGVLAVEGRRVHRERDARLDSGIDILMRHAARNMDDVAGFEMDALSIEDEIAVAAKQGYRGVVHFMHVQVLAIADLHDMLTGAWRAPEMHDFDIVTRCQRIVGKNPFQIELAIIIVVLQVKMRSRNAGGRCAEDHPKHKPAAKFY